jgi:polyphenol oxidase
LNVELDQLERVPFGGPAIGAWTTTRDTGSFGLGSTEPVHAVHARWQALQDALARRGVNRLATAVQVHGADVATHDGGWSGWLRMRNVDGHVTRSGGTALAVTVADCTPLFIAHPAGTVAVLHAGWRGVAAGILARGLAVLLDLGCPAEECEVHLGPSICGRCYEVGPEVIRAVSGRSAPGKSLLDIREVLLEQAQRAGVTAVSVSPWCTRCDNDRFFSHRAGDEGRQLGIIALLPGGG